MLLLHEDVFPCRYIGMAPTYACQLAILNTMSGGERHAYEAEASMVVGREQEQGHATEGEKLGKVSSSTIPPNPNLPSTPTISLDA